MRFSSVLKRLVGVTQLYVRGLVRDRDDALSIEVTPTRRMPRCARCGRRAPQYDYPRSVGRWQDLHLPPEDLAADPYRAGIMVIDYAVKLHVHHEAGNSC